MQSCDLILDQLVSLCLHDPENRSQVGLAPFAGTNAMWRVSSLYAVGGFQYGSVTEGKTNQFR